MLNSCLARSRSGLRWMSFLMLSTTVCLAQYERPGSTDAQFLKIGVSPRGTAMGDAFIAAVNGAEATYYNASALPWTRGTDIAVQHNAWFADIRHDFVAVSQGFGDYGALGLSFTALTTGLMDVRTPLQPEGTGETFTAGNYRLGLSYARFLTERVTIGATVSYIRMSLFRDFKTNAVSVDISTTYRSDFRGFRFAMQIGNFGSNIQYVDEAYPLPTNFIFGVSMNALESESQKLLVSGSAVKPNEGAPQGQVGIEWNYSDLFFLRAGHRINYSAATYSFGGGVQVAFGEMSVRFDYSYSRYVQLGSANRIGLGIAF